MQERGNAPFRPYLLFVSHAGRVQQCFAGAVSILLHAWLQDNASLRLHASLVCDAYATHATNLSPCSSC
eukprot:364100-Chlamydomonas_euryale.AAC.22